MLHKMVLASLLAVAACKATGPRDSGSALRDIAQQGPGQTIIVFHVKNSQVFKSSCADFNATANPATCQEIEKISWSMFNDGLEKQGLAAAKISDIKSFLEAPNLMHAESAHIKPYMAMIDAAVTGNFAPAGSGRVEVPPPSGTGNDLDKVAVLQAMEQTRSTFNMAKSTIDSCLANDVPDWSDIVIHYYCQHGMARSCFTGKARQYKSQGLSGKESYEKAYDDCVSDNDFKWVAQNQADVFRYLMFSVYSSGGVKTFKQEDQDWVINKFYQVNDPKDPNECNKRYIRRNETRPRGSHCVEGVPLVGSSMILEQGKYEGVNLPTGFCKEEQNVDPVIASGTMNTINVGWCGANHSSIFQCSGNICSDSNTYKIEPISPISYRFTMPTAVGVFKKVGGSSAASGSQTVLKRGSYVGSNLNASFCAQNQIVDPQVANSVMTRVGLGWCGAANSAVFNCNGATCTGSYTIEVLSDSIYTFDVGGHKATYTWTSSSMSP